MKNKTDEQIRKILGCAVVDEGSQKRFAEKCGVSAAYLNDMMHGRRAISAGVLAVLGYRRVAVYEEISQ